MVVDDPGHVVLGVADLEVSVAQPMPERTPEQVSTERAMGHVSEVLTNLDWTIEKVKKGLTEFKKHDGDDLNRGPRLALEDALKDLVKVRKRLFQDAYYGGDRLV